MKAIASSSGQNTTKVLTYYPKLEVTVNGAKKRIDMNLSLRGPVQLAEVAKDLSKFIWYAWGKKLEYSKNVQKHL